MGDLIAVPHPIGTRLTKRAFWNRFPVPNERAMRAIIAQGSPALLAGTFAQLQARVDSSPWVDVDLPQLRDALAEISSLAVPVNITIDGVTLPLRLTVADVARIVAPPVEDEAYRGAAS
jgi:hypothetical protein